MNNWKKSHELSRREKLYGFLIGQMMFTSTWHENHDGEGFFGTNLYSPPREPHFYLSNKFDKGDLVLTQGSLGLNPNIFNIGICDMKLGEHECIIRDIFTGDDCHYSNESFISAHNMPFHLTLTDKQHAYYLWFMKACRKVDAYEYRCCGAEFDDKNKQVRFLTRRRWADPEDVQIHCLKYGLRLRDIIDYLTKDLSKKEILNV